MTSVDALIFAGGRSSRMGGASKATITLNGRQLVKRVVEAARLAGAERVVVVGPDQAAGGADVVVRESPPFSGPGAALEAGVAEIEASWMLLLACDLENPRDVCATLMDASEDTEARDGVVLLDEHQHPQWLAGYYRTKAVREALAGRETQGIAVRDVLRSLDLGWRETLDVVVADIDTPADLAAARSRTI